MTAPIQTIADIARFLPCGDTAFTVELGEGVDADVNARVVALAQAAREVAPDGVLDIVPTFRSFTVHYDCRRIAGRKLMSRIGRLPVPPIVEAQSGTLFRIPAFYGGGGGPDLDAVAAHAGMDAADVAALHSSVEYRVYMLGFLPGFAYLGDLDERLRMPRLDTPRTRVPKGSIAIADAMTAIYPSNSPGGWRLIGTTPIDLFDPREGKALFAPGDRVRFEPVDAERYREIERSVRARSFEIERETP